MKLYKSIIILVIALKSLKGDKHLKVLEHKEKHEVMYGEPSIGINKPYEDDIQEYPGFDFVPTKTLLFYFVSLSPIMGYPTIGHSFKMPAVSISVNFANWYFSLSMKQGTDKDKLAENSRTWIKYYECLLQLTKALTKSLQLPNTIQRAYVGSVAKISCNLCVSPGEKDQIIWLYAASTKNLSFDIMKEKETAVRDIDLTIYNTQLEDAGVYQCRIGNSYSGVGVLEVTDREPYTLVKSRGGNPSPPTRVSGDTVIFTSWSPWSECSRCDLTGRRRRYGMCYVGHIDSENREVTMDSTQNETDRVDSNNNTSTSKHQTNDAFNVFNAFPYGIPCRSHMLPTPLQNVSSIRSRRNEIMIELCKVPCKNGVIEIRSQCGEVFETVNNTAGFYSLRQKKPYQPPAVVRDILFVSPGEDLTIRCPGTILRDIPVTWRKETKQLSLKDLIEKSEGRAYLNARDQIIFKLVEYTDAGVYSCWQGDILAGVIKLVVRRNPERIYKRRLALIATVLVLTMMLRLMTRYLQHRRRMIM